jgi:hypothetical protein
MLLTHLSKKVTHVVFAITDSIEVLPESERTVDYLKSKMKLKKTESVTQTSNDTSNVLKQTQSHNLIVLVVENLAI